MRTTTGSSTVSKPSASRPGRCSPTRRTCCESTASGTGLPRARLRARHSPTGVANTTAAVARPCRRASRQPRRAAGRVEPERVDDRGQPAPQPVLDDLVEQRERVLARREVLLALTDHRPQPVARHHLVGGEVLGRPRRLARPRRAHQHHQARGRQQGGPSPAQWQTGTGARMWGRLHLEDTARVLRDVMRRPPLRHAEIAFALAVTSEAAFTVDARRRVLPVRRRRRCRPRRARADAARPRSGPPSSRRTPTGRNRVRVLVVVVVVRAAAIGDVRAAARVRRAARAPSTGSRSWRRSRWPRSGPCTRR